MDDPAEGLNIPEPTPNSAPDAPSEEPAEGEIPSGEPAVPQEPSEDAPKDTYEVGGRQLTGEELKEEYTKLNKDYTVKSQELSTIKNPQAPPEEPQYDWQKPDWQPKSYQEIIDAGEQKADLKRAAEEQAQAATEAQREEQVKAQLDEIRKIEPDLSEDLLFQHANKYKLTDLVSAFHNMQDFKLAVKTTEEKTVKNMKQRGQDPVDTKSGAGAENEGVDYHAIGDESPQEMLARVKG